MKVLSYCEEIICSIILSLCLLFQLVANAVLFLCVNCVGIFHRWMTEHDLRKSNQKREEFSAIRSRKEIKKYQQVKKKLNNMLNERDESTLVSLSH